MLSSITPKSMEFLIPLPISTSSAITILSFIIFLFSLLYLIQKISNTQKKHRKTAPEVAGAWPIIGHLHLVGGQQPLHIKLASWADKYGPIFSIKLGVYKTIVVSDSELAKECFTTNDKIFAARAKSLPAELMGYNYAVLAVGPYGPYWRQVRKMVILEFLSKRRIEMLAHIQVSELKSSMKVIYDIWHKGNGLDDVKVEMKEYFEQLTMNGVVQMVVGKSCLPKGEGGVRFRKAMKKLLDLLGTFMVSDVIPYLSWLDLGGYKKIMRKASKDMDDIIEVWLKEHREKRDLGLVKTEQRDFMDAMLAHVDGAADDDFPGFDADTINKAVCLTLLSGATETIIISLTWALSLLMTHPNAMKKVQDELDTHVGKNRQVKQSDLTHLSYLQAVIKETLRLYPAAPIGIPHEAMEDCIVGGYNIPKGTRLFVNIWKIHHNPEAWSDPFEFRPERFLTSHKDVDVRGQHFDLIPFGSGRRMCPGVSLGLQAVQLTIASLIHGFELKTPSNEPIDMTVLPGLANVKATPLEVLLSPRLPAQVYA